VFSLLGGELGTRAREFESSKKISKLEMEGFYPPAMRASSLAPRHLQLSSAPPPPRVRGVVGGPDTDALPLLTLLVLVRSSCCCHNNILLQL
jgi:hypothetical protein